jgi:FkbM family methyltransferase
MSVRQFANSLSIIRRAEEANRGTALVRHLMWQGRKLLFPRPMRLPLSQSVIMDDEPGGVIGLVNMLGCYDYNNMNLIQSLLAQSPAGIAPVFLDVGANIGAYTLIASEVPAATVVSLEPIPAAFEKLRENVRLNRRDRVVLLQVAAGRERGALRMTCNGASTFNQVIESGDDGTTTVAADTLDAICARLALNPAVIKIDVEGHEPAVLDGAAACLQTCQACVVENGDRPAIVAFMHAHGMAGPFHYRHRLLRMQRAPQRLPEDPVFIGGGFERAYPAISVETD